MLYENNWRHYGLKVIFVGLRVTLYQYYHYADLGESIEHMKCLQVHILSSMCPRLTIFPRLSFVQYMGLSGFSLPISLRMIVRLFALHLVIITKSEIWIISRSLTQNGRRFADDTFKCIFLNENVKISIKLSLKFVAKGPINNISAFVQIMAWRRPGDKPLSEPMLVFVPTHICVTRPQWVKARSWNNDICCISWFVLFVLFCFQIGRLQRMELQCFRGSS